MAVLQSLARVILQQEQGMAAPDVAVSQSLARVIFGRGPYNKNKGWLRLMWRSCNLSQVGRTGPYNKN